MVTLTAGRLALALDAECGGAIASFTLDGRPVFRPVSDPALIAQHGRSVAGYPLVPFSNRIGYGRFEWNGMAFQLAPNFDGEPHTIHGNGWMHPWTVEAAGSREARLRFEHSPAGGGAREWPFRYAATQLFRLDERALEVTIAVTNLDGRTMPAGVGLHPYCAREPATTLQFDADAVWRTGDDGLPETRLPVGGHWDFRTGRPIAPPKIDDCYAGWRGPVRIASPSGTLTVAAVPDHRALGHLVLFTPEGRDYFGIEPVSNMSNALNHQADAGSGLVALRTGERLEATIRFAPLERA